MGRPYRKNIPDALRELIQHVGRNVVCFRQEKGLRQAELAGLAQISVTTLNEIETLKPRDIRLSTLCAIARALNINTVTLLSDSDVDLSPRDQDVLLKASEAILRVTRKLR